MLFEIHKYKQGNYLVTTKTLDNDCKVIYQGKEETKMAYDTISNSILCDNLVAVTDNIMLETVNENITQEVKRGIYTFNSFKEARHFTTVVNDASGNETAHLFTRNKGE